MTPTDLAIEHRYRIEERLGILCEDREPTEEQYQLARREADQWWDEWERRERIENERD